MAFTRSSTRTKIEGVAYQPIEELYADPDCIGCAPVSFFDDDKTVARMAHGADEDDDELDVLSMPSVSCSS